MEGPLISIIIPVYKVEDYLDRCLESVVNQTYKNLEIILVDDGSPDNCPAMCDEWAEKDSRIKVIHKENDGLANARNSGLAIATGEYIQFIDSDDFVDKDIVEFLYNLISENNAQVARCGFYTYDNGNDIAQPYNDNVRIIEDKNELFIDLINGGHLSGVAWNKLYKTETVMANLYSKQDGSSEDILHNFRVYKCVDKLVCCDIPKYHYCVNSDSITQSEFGYGAFSIIRAREIMLDAFKDNNEVLPYAIEWYIRSAYIVLSGCIKSGKCLDRYDELRNGILKYKKFIFKSKSLSFNHKIRTVILMLSPIIYNLVIKMKG